MASWALIMIIGRINKAMLKDAERTVLPSREVPSDCTPKIAPEVRGAIALTKSARPSIP
jgi:hypothetical protein